MTSYMILKHLHMTTAYLTITLFALRLLLDAVGRPGWRQTPLRFIPHINDTVLLVAAIALVFVAGYASAMPGWLIAKIVLLIGYILAGVFALKTTVSKPVRIVAAVLALVQVSAIFHLAMAKPF
ncbi:SirB2 family protein [Marinobacter daepoensis]|uniref:SirB2 family protein n=1 Tax=Marinobacter daepoensis TaxID=262077 RepID=A0ABS3BGL5_9GAMM|nr:SirB2 family protein [Marinobacter daepoensis]MBN7770804.1 SirB2 family protein [Marinobacter daepoensis]MBY6033152.1 SirB2 family protein [Marinobacter daepoensis]MBY6078665.1 SirB2 family protein [Marinobacter daepoensis]